LILQEKERIWEKRGVYLLKLLEEGVNGATDFSRRKGIFHSPLGEVRGEKGKSHPRHGMEKMES